MTPPRKGLRLVRARRRWCGKCSKDNNRSCEFWRAQKLHAECERSSILLSTASSLGPPHILNRPCLILSMDLCKSKEPLPPCACVRMLSLSLPLSLFLSGTGKPAAFSKFQCGVANNHGLGCLLCILMTRQSTGTRSALSPGCRSQPHGFDQAKTRSAGSHYLSRQYPLGLPLHPVYQGHNKQPGRVWHMPESTPVQHSHGLSGHTRPAQRPAGILIF